MPLHGSRLRRLHDVFHESVWAVLLDEAGMSAFKPVHEVQVELQELLFQGGMPYFHFFRKSLPVALHDPFQTIFPADFHGELLG